MFFATCSVEIATLWNVKGKISDYLYRTQKSRNSYIVECKAIVINKIVHFFFVEIATLWNVKYC